MSNTLIDTTTINYGIEKIGQAVQAAAPHVANVSQKYVEYAVYKAVAALTIASAGVLACMVISIIGFCWWGRRRWNENAVAPQVLAFIPLVAAIILAAVGVPKLAYDCIIALHCPEMFAVQQFINSVK